MNNEIFPLIEMSTVIQGEGKLAGVPHLLFRFTGCSCRCKWCDAWYTSWKPEKQIGITINEIYKFIIENKQITHSMITGGDPYMYSTYLSTLYSALKIAQHHITVETQGTFYENIIFDLLSLSPKFSNSDPKEGEILPFINRPVSKLEAERHIVTRKQYNNMAKLINTCVNYQIKPVISNSLDFEELEELIYILGNSDEVIDKYRINIPNNKIYCMPEGTTEDELQKSRQWLISECVKRGYNYSDRLHIVAFGNKRGM